MKKYTLLDWPDENRLRLIAAAILIGLFLVLQSDTIHSFGASLTGHELERQNIAYLKHAEHQARNTFIKLSEIFALLKVIESSQVGISFVIHTDVTIGNAIASFTNLVGRAIVVSLAAAASSASLKELVVLIEVLNPLLFKAALLLSGIYLILASISRKNLLTSASRGLCEIAIIMFLTTYFIIPYSVHATGWISQQIIAEVKQKTHTKLDNLHKTIAPHQGDKSTHDKRAHQALHRFDHFVVDIKHKVESMSLIFVQQISTMLIEGILLPLGLILVLFYSLKRIAKQMRRIYLTDLAEAGSQD